MSAQHHRPGVEPLDILSRVALDAMLAKVQIGESLSLAEQRALLAQVFQEREQGADNLNRLVAAREKFDALIRDDGPTGRPLDERLLVGLLELGTTLGRSA